MMKFFVLVLVVVVVTNAEDTDTDSLIPESQFVARHDSTVSTVFIAFPNEVHVEHGGLGFHGKFLGETTGNSLLYDAVTKEPLLSVHTVGNTAKMRFERDAPIKFPTATGQSAPFLDEINKASIAMFDAAMKSLESLFPKILALSKYVGTQGFQGNTYPVTLWLHNLAVTAMRKKPDVLELMQESEEGTARAKWFFFRRRRTCTTPKFSKKPIDFCGNKCFGLCGNGCNCWTHVCGDCNSHQGCWEHDAYCSCCSLANPRCATFMANSATCNTPLCANSYCKYKAKRKFECVWGCGGAPSVRV